MLHRKALVHGHCHEKATSGFDPAKKLLQQMGIELDCPDSGCCGMAGAWGYERAHYDVSMACGERVLLPEVRKAPSDALIVTDGFSCKTQIEQGAHRHSLHVAEVIRLAQGETVARPQPTAKRRLARGAALAGVAAAAGAALTLHR